MLVSRRASLREEPPTIEIGPGCPRARRRRSATEAVSRASGAKATPSAARPASPPSRAVSTQRPSVVQRHGVLPVGGPGAVDGDDGPVVGQHPGRRGRRRVSIGSIARHMPGAHASARVAGAVVEDVRVLVHLGADAVADVLLDDAVAGSATKSSTACADRRSAALPAAIAAMPRHIACRGDLDQRPRRPASTVTVGRHDDGEGRVAVPAVEDRAAVDRDEVARLRAPGRPGCRARPRR